MRRKDNVRRLEEPDLFRHALIGERGPLKAQVRESAQQFGLIDYPPARGVRTTDIEPAARLRARPNGVGAGPANSEKVLGRGRRGHPWKSAANRHGATRKMKSG